MSYSIGLRIRMNREEKGITQKRLAELVGVHEAVISNWETGRNRPSVDVLVLLCEALGVSADELLNLNIATRELSVDTVKMAKRYDAADETTKKIIRNILD